jgi:Na+-driven multidrug efflux pump
MNGVTPGRELIALAAISGAEGLALIGYACYDVIQAIRFGTTGPAEVSNGPALFIQILIFMVFGIGLLLIARGWLQGQRWSRSPFVLAQLMALLVAFPLAQDSSGPGRAVGVSVLICALVGGVLALTPQVGRAIRVRNSQTD